MKPQTKNSDHSQSSFRKSVANACSAFIFFVVTQAPAGAEPGFPNKPLRIFLSQGPGAVGVSPWGCSQTNWDSVSQQFVSDNRPGAGGLSHIVTPSWYSGVNSRARSIPRSF
jgi:hypothetical protein